MNRLTRKERRWIRAFAQRKVEDYLADRDAGRLASPSPAPPVPTRAPQATPTGEERFTIRNRADLSLGELARLSDPPTRRDHCGRLYVIFDRMEPQDQQRTVGCCGTRDAFEADVAEYNRQIAYLEGLRPPPPAAYTPSLIERAAAAQTGSSSVRVYDGRTGTYQGTEVMSDHEAEMRGASPVIRGHRGSDPSLRHGAACEKVCLIRRSLSVCRPGIDPGPVSSPRADARRALRIA